MREAIPRGPLGEVETLARSLGSEGFHCNKMTPQVYALMCERKRGVVVNIFGAVGEWVQWG
jgi:hypothetical protein